MVLLLAGCGEREDGKAEDAAGSGPVAPAMVWRTGSWPMARGGAQLQGRVHDPVPRGPVVEWSLRASEQALAEPAFGGGMLVFGDATGTVHAVDFATRKTRWSVVTEDSVEAAPAIASGRVFLGSNDGTFRALDLGSGRELWKIESSNKFPTGAVVVAAKDGERVLVNGYDGTARCLRAADGGVVWSHETENYLNGSPAVIDGKWVAFGGCDAAIHTVGLDDGKDAAKMALEAQVTTSVATLGTMVYAVNYANQLVAAEARGTKPEWIYQDKDVPFESAPGVDEKRVYVGSRDKHLHAVDRLTGKVAWKFRAGGRVGGAPLVFDDAVVFGSADGILHAVSKEDGQEIWKLDLGEDLAAAPAFAEGRLMVAGGDGTMFVIGGK